MDKKTELKKKVSLAVEKKVKVDTAEAFANAAKNKKKTILVKKADKKGK